MNSSLHLTINSCLRRLLGSCWFVFELSLGSHGVVVGSVKISKSLKQIIVSSILSLASSLFRIVSFVLFYLLGRIKESINCFRDLLPFNNTQQQLDDYALKAQQPSNNCTITPWKPGGRHFVGIIGDISWTKGLTSRGHFWRHFMDKNVHEMSSFWVTFRGHFFGDISWTFFGWIFVDIYQTIN